MRLVVLIVCLQFALLFRSEAQGAPSQDSTLTLQEAVDTALAQHPTLRIGQATVEAAQQLVRQQNLVPRAWSPATSWLWMAVSSPRKAGVHSLVVARQAEVGGYPP
ncbi:MAG: hypothetical protein HYZ72_00775 [Deltaproteobacteria bacterium]|nr:hypothetical protein [Deltaproteobacteria bacterium]